MIKFDFIRGSPITRDFMLAMFIKTRTNSGLLDQTRGQPTGYGDIIMS